LAFNIKSTTDVQLEQFNVNTNINCIKEHIHIDKLKKAQQMIPFEFLSGIQSMFLINKSVIKSHTSQNCKKITITFKCYNLKMKRYK